MARSAEAYEVRAKAGFVGAAVGAREVVGDGGEGGAWGDGGSLARWMQDAHRRQREPGRSHASPAFPHNLHETSRAAHTATPAALRAPKILCESWRSLRLCGK